MPRFGKVDARGRSSGIFTGRRAKLMRPPPGEPWVWLTAEMLASNAWRSLGINARRFIDFLMIEQMNHAGTENGRLKATYGQLKAFGLTLNCIASAIEEAERAGWVDCQKGGMRVATTYTLTWLPLPNGTPPTNRWKQVSNQKSAPRSESSKPPEVRAERANLPPEMRADQTPRSDSPSISRRGSVFGERDPSDDQHEANSALHRKNGAGTATRKNVADGDDQS